MTLHRRESVRDQLTDSVFAAHDLAKAAPKYRFPNEEWLPVEAFQVVSDQIMLDGNSRQNLATFCQTWEEPEVHRLMDLSLDKNMIDKDEYPQTAEIEKRCVHMLADLWNAPDSARHGGLLDHRVVRGLHVGRHGRQVALAGEAAGRGQVHRLAQHGVRAGPGRVAQVRQVLGHRDARGARCRPGHYAMDAADMLERVDENTIMVVPTFGVTYTGSYEFVKPLADALDDLAGPIPD